MVTDPAGDAWIDSSGNEDGDLCITTSARRSAARATAAWNEEIHGGHYYLQEEWSNADSGCQPRARGPPASRSRRTGSTGTPRRSRSRPHAAPIPHGPIVSYTWFFGDGREAHGAERRRIATTAPGSYRVVLRATDSWA